MKTRVKLKHFMRGNIVSPLWIVEALIDRRWVPVRNDECEVKKHDTREDAEFTANRLKGGAK